MSILYVRDKDGQFTQIPIFAGQDSGGNVDLTGYAKEQWVQQNYQPKGNYALKSEIPSVPVQSVNNKTGAVKLSASDVGARPENWMPTAQEVGALPNTYTPPNQTAEQVGADPKGTATAAVSQHNTAEDSHNDIRLELKAINERLTAFFDSDNQTLDELSEIVAYITSNKSLIDAITTTKINIADIINNLTTNVSDKPLSAAQGVVLKGLIDTLSNNLANYQPVGDYALKSQIPTVPTKVSAFDNDAGYLTKHQDISHKLDASELPTAINTALEQAKTSGEFDGADGKDGSNGVSATHSWSGTVLTVTSASGTSSADLKGAKGDSIKGDPGADGVSPTVAVSKSGKVTTVSITDKSGTKTATINDGVDGSAGKDGTSVTHSWNGTTLTVTSASGTSSANLKGEKGDKGDTGGTGATGTSVTVKSVSESTADGGSNVITFSDGKTVTIKNGSKGSTGTAGKTPVKGVDYWTEADKESIVQEVIAALGTPVFGTVDTDNNIILTGNLVNGTYTLKYEDAEGNQTDIGTVKIGSSYTNLAGTITENVRISSSGSTKESVGAVVTDYIPCEQGDVLRIKGIDILTDPLPDGTNSATIGMYKGDKTANGILYPKNDPSKYTTTNGITTFVLNTGSATDIAYIRICGTPIAGEEIIVTVNEEIDDNSGGPSKPVLVNQIPISTDTDGSIYNGKGYKENTRISASSGSISTLDGVDLTGFIPVTMGDVIRMKNVDFKWATIGSSGGLHYYASDKTTKLLSLNTSGYPNIQDISPSEIKASYDDAGNLVQFTVTTYADLIDPAYLRVCASDITDESIITVNQEINEEIV